jgi:DNA-binding transcriptional regulator LsrR (DeoR family)
MVGISLEELRAIPERLCVAGGPDKEIAVAGALRGGYATHLVTDERTARRLLELS